MLVHVSAKPTSKEAIDHGKDNHGAKALGQAPQQKDRGGAAERRDQDDLSRGKLIAQHPVDDGKPGTPVQEKSANRVGPVMEGSPMALA